MGRKVIFNGLAIGVACLVSTDRTFADALAEATPLSQALGG
jgi:hypothetical protein